MKTAVILCNGEFPKKEYPLWLLRSADIIICCDSALNVGRLRRMGLEPTLLVGDMDSTPEKVQNSLGGRVVKIEEQDDNDLAKAFNLLRKRYPEATQIHILGAGGKNEAHTVGNLGWLMEWERRSLAETGSGLSEQGVNVDMVSDWSTAFALSPSYSGSERTKLSPVEIYVGEGRRISFFSTDSSLRIVSAGLEWPLEGVDLSRWWAATLNRSTSDTVSLGFNRQVPLLVVLD